MSDKKTWTPAQEDAITAKGCSLAVSAAAGSGKTSVLTERIVNLIASGEVRADRLAVVTFTKAAAAELESRLYNALAEKAGKESDNEHLSRQLFRLSQAQISTIHSFALTLIQEHKKKLNLGETVRVGDPSECTVLLKKAIEDAIGIFLKEAEGDEAIRRETLCSLFASARSLAGLSETVLTLMKAAGSCPGGLAWFRSKAESATRWATAIEAGEATFFQSPFGEVIRKEVQSKLRSGAIYLETLIGTLSSSQLVGETYIPHFEEKARTLRDLADKAEKGDLFSAWQGVERLFEGGLPKILKCPPEESDIKNFCQNVHNKKVKDPLKKFLSSVAGQPAPDLLCDLKETALLSHSLLDLADLAEARYRAAKREKSLVDYTDLEQMLLSLVAEEKGGVWQPTSLAKTIGDGFDAVFVDEYQDTNRIQDLIFRFIAGEDKLFLVGDPKQSIYRFRGAEPEIFAQYKQKLSPYKKGEKGMQKILLSHNFRCDEAVIDLVNTMFGVMMDDTDPTSLYLEEDRLVFSKKAKDWENRFPAELVLLPQDEEGAQSEADYIANRIARILNGEIKKEGDTPFEPGDIAVLCRYASHFTPIKKALADRGIPYTSSEGEKIKEDPEYLFVFSLLGALSNPLRDIPLLGTLLSPVFRFSPDALYRIRKLRSRTPFLMAMEEYERAGDHSETRIRIKETLSLLKELREESRRLTPEAFLFSLYRRFSLDLMFPDTAQPGLVRSFLMDAAKTFSASGVRSVGEFCRYLEQCDTAALSAHRGGVRLMTVHKSKGLEFPIVFVSSLERQYNLEEEKKTLILHRNLGSTFHLPRLEGKAKWNTLMRKAALIQNRADMVEEEKRILYVAMTRARNKLILTAAVKKTEQVQTDLMLFSSEPMPRSFVTGRLSEVIRPLPLVLFSLRDHPLFRQALSQWKSTQSPSFSVFVEGIEEEVYIPPKETSAANDGWAPDGVLAHLSFEYPDKELERLPQKLSVSQILKGKREEEAPEFYPRRLLDFEKGTLKTGAERIGTATHQVMQFADFAAMEKDPEKEFTRLVQKGFCSPEDMALVDRQAVLSFFSSPLYHEMQKAVKTVHEKRFNVLVDAEEIGVGKGTVLVQGVVDAWFEKADGTVTILDFKTDRVKKEDGEAILLSRHAEQLRLYAKAVEKMTEKKVSHLYLYSFSLQRAVPVSLNGEE